MLLSLQVKRSIISNNLIISNKHGIYELPHALPGNLRLSINSRYKIQKLYFCFYLEKKFFGGGGHEYEHYFGQVN